jgi:hypothetical protein
VSASSEREQILRVLLDVDMLGDAILAEHEAAKKLLWLALTLAAAAAEGRAAPERVVAALANVAAQRMIALVALRLLRELGPEVAECRRDELVRRVLDEGPPEVFQ